MTKSIYDFKSEDAERFANFMGITARPKGNELQFLTCPFCRGGKSRDKNTFSISLKTGQCECKRSSCGYKGNMITLAQDKGFELSEDVSRYYNQNNYNDRFKKFKDAKKAISSTDKAVEYLKSRGISEEICRKYDITTKDNRILVFPFRDENENIVFIKYRDINYNSETSKGHKEWCESDCKPILFGMNKANPEDGPLVITEGQIDSLSIAEAGIPNSVSVPFGCNAQTWIAHCWDWVHEFAEIVVFGDCEKGKITIVDMVQRFGIPYRVVKEQDYCGFKDANEILVNNGPDAIKDAIERAEKPKDKRIICLSDVEDIDLDNMESISTCINEIDDVLKGGFHAGELILLTGKRGDGKSTFMGQMIVSALTQNYKTFVYSGELSNSFFKAWLDKQVTGKWKIEQSEQTKLREYYRDKVFLYDSSCLADDNEMEQLLKTVDIAINQYDCKFICIDNLMTAIETDSNEKLYRMQSKFVGSLKDMAKKHNVVVVLVAHPRKSNGYQSFQNDDVSGSADITNKVDVVMSYSRVTADVPERDIEDCRELLITKNRLTGALTGNKKHIYLYYSQESKRIVGKDRNFNFYTGWNGEFLDASDDDLPF